MVCEIIITLPFYSPCLLCCNLLGTIREVGARGLARHSKSIKQKTGEKKAFFLQFFLFWYKSIFLLSFSFLVYT